MIQFDVLLKDIGELGLGQLIVMLMLVYANIAGGLNGLAPVFIAYRPSFRCNVSPLDNKTIYNLSESQILNLTTPYNAETENYNGCYRYGYDLDACQENLICVNKSATEIRCDQGYHYDDSVFTNTIMTEFNLVCDDAYLNTLSISLYPLGTMIGSIVFGNFADKVGRKTCSLVTFIGGISCMLGVSFSRSIVVYIVLRMGTAAFLYGNVIGTYVYTMEIVGKKWRTAAGMAYQSVFSIGFIILSGVAYNWRDWHEITLISVIVSAPYIIFVILLPESPRWLFVNNKEERAIKVTNRLARINKKTISEETWIEARKAGELCKKNNSSEEKKYSSIDLFRTKDTAIITLKIAFNWFVNSFVYYGISLNAGALAGDLFINNILNGIFEIASYLFCFFVMDRIGRRILLTFLLLLAGFGLIISITVNEFAGENQALITTGLVFAFISKFGISGSFAVVYNLSSELFPTVIRSNGIGIGSVSARIGSIISPFFIDLQDLVVWLPNAIFGVFSIAAGLLALTFPETNGHVMMETIEEAEMFYRGEHISEDRKDEKKLSSSSISKRMKTEEGFIDNITRL